MTIVLLMKEEVPNDKFAKKINSLQKIPLLKVQKFASLYINHSVSNCLIIQ